MDKKIKVTFFCKVDKSALALVEFYNQDIEILNILGYSVKIATKYSEIDWKSDILFIWWWTYAFLPIAIGRLFKIKTIITGTFNYFAPLAPSDYFRRPLVERLLIKFSIKNANFNVLVSKNEYDQIKQDWQLKNIIYCPHIIDTNKYSFSSKRESRVVFSVIWTGSQNLKRKCLPEIIQSARIVRDIYPDIVFIVAGRKGDGYSKVLDSIKNTGLDNTVKLIGEISEEEKISYLQKCTIYLQPSKYEGFGVAIAEAMSCGAPVITTEVGEIPNVVGDAVEIINTSDPKAISKSIISLLNDDERRNELGKKATVRIKEKFNKSIRVDALKNIIEK